MMKKGFNYKKAVQALNFFAEKYGGAVNKMKALKLIWLADRFHLRTYGRTIIGDVYFALPYGPVASATRDILQANSFSLSESETSYSQEFLQIVDQYSYQSAKGANLKVFSKSDLSSLEKAFEYYGSLDRFELSEISHQFPEWQKFESALKRGDRSRYEMNYEDFFNNDNGNNPLFIADEEELNLTKNLFLRTDNQS